MDKEDKFPEFRSLMKKMGSMGLNGMTIKEEYGGSDLSFLECVVICEEISRASASFGLSWGAHVYLNMLQIQRHGTEEQKRKYLPKLCRGETIGALAMSESDSGSDVTSMKTTAVKDGDYYVINGSKCWITNGPHADVYVIYAKTEPDKNHKGISAFIIERETEGFTTGPPFDKLGMRGSGTGELFFDNCKVHKSQLLGGYNKGVYVLMSGLDYERFILTAAPVGLMQACCDVAFEYAHQRKQFGSPIGEFQLIQGKMADMYTTLSACRSYLYNVARAADKGHLNSKDCAGVVLYCSEKATRVALDAIQILGGNGYINDYPTGRFLRDAKLFEIGAGTSEIRRLIIGRALNSEYK